MACKHTVDIITGYNLVFLITLSNCIGVLDGLIHRILFLDGGSQAGCHASIPIERRTNFNSTRQSIVEETAGEVSISYNGGLRVAIVAEQDWIETAAVLVGEVVDTLESITSGSDLRFRLGLRRESGSGGGSLRWQSVRFAGSTG